MIESVKNIAVKNYNFPNSKIEFWENGIVYYEIQPNTEIDIQVSKNLHEVLLENYVNNEKYFILADIGEFSTITKEAREFSARPEVNEIRKAVAVIMYSLAHRLIINFQAKFVLRQKVKMKAFQSKEIAIAWLLQQKRLSS